MTEPESQDTSQHHVGGSSGEDTSDEQLPAGDQHRVYHADNTSSRLESLPSELRVLVLSSVPDLPTLRSIVRASPVMHAQYRHDRNLILCACLGRELGGFLVDAYATSKSRVCEMELRTDEAITGFLGNYDGWLTRSNAMPSIREIRHGRIRWMTAFHLSVARPLVRLYSDWALSNLRKAVSTSTNQEAEPRAESSDEDVEDIGRKDGHVKLTRSEEIRIFRALYRYHTFQHLFGQNKGDRWGGFRHHEIHEMFFCILDPWEAEAVGCIDLFVRRRYEELFDQVQADLHPKNERFRLPNGIFNPEGSYDLIDERDDFLEGTVSRGLKMTARLLAIDDHEKLVATMERSLTHAQHVDHTMRQALSAEAQDDRRLYSVKYPTARDEAETTRDPMRFAGDAVPPDTPPFAWVALWGGKYSNICGEYVPLPLRQWGYVMWDERRLTGMGAGVDFITAHWARELELVREIEMDYGWKPLDLDCDAPVPSNAESTE